MKGEILVREARPGDLRAVLGLYAQPGMDDGEVLGIEAAQPLFEQMHEVPGLRLFVAEAGGQVVGTFVLLILQLLSHRGACAGMVESVAVDPAWQRRGVGCAMMARALELCRARGCYKLALSSNVRRQAAHLFYERLGFERHGYSFRVSP